jgi:hypothetical protein
VRRCLKNSNFKLPATRHLLPATRHRLATLFGYQRKDYCVLFFANWAWLVYNCQFGDRRRFSGAVTRNAADIMNDFGTNKGPFFVLI